MIVCHFVVLCASGRHVAAAAGAAAGAG